MTLGRRPLSNFCSRGAPSVEPTNPESKRRKGGHQKEGLKRGVGLLEDRARRVAPLHLPHMSANFRKCQQMSANIKKYQQTSLNTRKCQEMRANINKRQQMSATVSAYRQMPARSTFSRTARPASPSPICSTSQQTSENGRTPEQMTWRSRAPPRPAPSDWDRWGTLPICPAWQRTSKNISKCQKMSAKISEIISN